MGRSDSQPSTSLSSSYTPDTRRATPSPSLGFATTRGDDSKLKDQGNVGGGGSSKRRYEKLRLLSKIVRRLEGEIAEAEAQFERRVDDLGRRQAGVVHKIEMGHKGGASAMKTSLGKLESKCKELESDLVQNNKKWVEEIKTLKFGHRREVEERNAELESEREHFQRTLLKHKEAKDLWLKTDLENAEYAKAMERNLEKFEKKQSYLTKELDETLDHLHEAQHKLLAQEMETNMMRSELASAKERLTEAKAEMETLRSKQGGHEGSPLHRAESPVPGSSSRETVAVHLYGGEEQKRRLEERQRHVVSLEREVKRLKEQLKSIRSEEMARHSVVLSELEERLQHSEKMGLKARIGASHVVKRIRDLLNKYYAPSGGERPARVTKKIMEQIQHELMLIFEKLEDLDHPGVSMEGEEETETESTASEGSFHSPGERRGTAVGNEISDRRTTQGTAMTEREALIYECAEYSIQNSEQTEKLSEVAQLEMQLLDSKVEAEKTAKEAFESIQKAQQLERELGEAKQKLTECEKVLARKKSDWVSITKYAEATKRADKAEALARSLREETNRQKTALRFAKQEKDQKEEELRYATTSGFDLHQHCKKLQDDLKSANFQMKHLRGYCDILKSQKEQELDKLRVQHGERCADLEGQVKRMARRADNLRASEANLESRLLELGARLDLQAEAELGLRDEILLEQRRAEGLEQERAKAEKTLLETVKRLEVSEANVRYFKDRRGCGEADRELTLESVFDIFVGGSE